MGQAILYCYRCSTQLRETHFEQGKAFRLDSRVCCADCAPEALRTLPPDRVKDLLVQLSAPPQKTAPSSSHGSSRTMGAATPRRGVPEIPAARSPQPAIPPVWIAAGVAVLLIVVAIAVLLNSGPSTPVLTPTPPPLPPPVGKGIPKPPPVKPPEPPVDSAARDALRNAKDFARIHPDDLFGQLRQFEDLILLGDKTEAGNEARQTSQQLRAKGKESVEKALSALDAEIAAPLGREEFSSVFASLDAAKARMEWPDWKFAVDKRSREHQEKMEKLYEPLKEKAKEAKEKGSAAELDAQFARVKKWGVHRLMNDLSDVLATVPSPPVKVSIETIEKDPANWGYVGGWEFPGAKGSFGPDATVSHGGSRSYKLSADFTGGGAYVGTWCDTQGMKERDFRELRVWLKTGTVANVGIRLADSTDQIHQKNGGIALKPTTDWQELVIRVSDVVGGEHWGGANDARWHGPLKGFGINVGNKSFKGSDVKSGVVWFDDVEGMVVLTPGRDQ
jgi:hypothetical protein